MLPENVPTADSSGTHWAILEYMRRSRNHIHVRGTGHGYARPCDYYTYSSSTDTCCYSHTSATDTYCNAHPADTNIYSHSRHRGASEQWRLASHGYESP